MPFEPLFFFQDDGSPAATSGALVFSIEVLSVNNAPTFELLVRNPTPYTLNPSPYTLHSTP